MLGHNDNRVPAVDKEHSFFIENKLENKVIELTEVIGAGGSCIAYKGLIRDIDAANGNIPRACVVKELYPYKDKRYVRKNVGDEISLNVEGSIYDNFLEKQEEEVGIEKDISRQLAYDAEKQNNLPYLYEVRNNTVRKGGTLYMILDTGTGSSLRGLLNEQSQYRFTIEQKLHLFEKIAVAVNKTLINRNDCKMYCHGDLRPENVFLAGYEEGAISAARPMILDFGSAFDYADYKCVSIEEKSDSEIARMADDIINASKRWGSDYEYTSRKMNEINKKSLVYMFSGDEEDGRKLIDAMIQIDGSIDLYSLMKIFLDIMKPADNYTSDITQFIHRVKEKIDDGYYFTVENVENDIAELWSLIRNEANPKVLIRELQMQCEWMKAIDIDEKLFGEIKIE